jgi:hypothetical protein
MAQGNPAPLLLVAALLFALVALVAVVAARRRARSAPVQGAPAAPQARVSDPAPAVTPGQAWAPPRYAETRAAASGPSFSVGVSTARLQGANLLVMWNGVNEGSVPVAVQWGSPRIQSAGGNALVLRYTTDTDDPATFAPPEMRVCEPGEIVSRSAQVTLPPFDAAAGSLRVTIAVGYGPADGLPGAGERAEAYAAWQLTAVSAPRSVMTR